MRLYSYFYFITPAYSQACWVGYPYHCFKWQPRDARKMKSKLLVGIYEGVCWLVVFIQFLLSFLSFQFTSESQKIVNSIQFYSSSVHTATYTRKKERKSSKKLLTNRTSIRNSSWYPYTIGWFFSQIIYMLRDNKLINMATYGRLFWLIFTVTIIGFNHIG